jgi:serine/threonine-protein kinase
MASPALVGKTVGNYVIRSLLGEGGMGAVYAAEHRFLGDKVAIKLLHGSFAHDPGLAQRFYLEAKASRDIDHPNIIRIIDFGQSEDGSLYLVMELLEGQSLAELIERGALAEESAASVGAAIADGLAAAHDKGIIHRDLKPGNVFVSHERVKILDFGIAKIFSVQTNTRTDVTFGTPSYMAPEQAKGAKHVGPATDIYALGCILYEMVTGSRPFVGTQLEELLAQIFFSRPARPSEILPISKEMESLVLQCLEKDPEARPKSMVDVRERLLRMAAPDYRRAKQLTLTFRKTNPRPFKAASLPSTLSGSASEIPTVDASTRIGTRARVSGFVLGAVGLVLVGGLAAGLASFRRAQPEPSAHPIVAPSVAAPAPQPAPAPVAAPAPPATQKVVLHSRPEGAEIIVDDRSAGTTPTVLDLALPHPLVLKRKGYRQQQAVVTAAGDTTVVLEREPRPTRHRPTKGEPARPGAPSGFHEGLD